MGGGERERGRREELIDFRAVILIPLPYRLRTFFRFTERVRPRPRPRTHIHNQRSVQNVGTGDETGTGEHRREGQHSWSSWVSNSLGGRRPEVKIEHRPGRPALDPPPHLSHLEHAVAPALASFRQGDPLASPLRGGRELK